MMEFDNPKDTQKLQLRRRLREILVAFPQIIENQPNCWWRETAKMIVHAKRDLDNEPPEIKDYLKEYLPFVLDSLRQESKTTCDPSETNTIDGCAVRVDKEISNLSMLMAKRFDKEGEVVNENVISLEDLVRTHPENFSLDESNIQGIDFWVLTTTPFRGSETYPTLIPKFFPFGYKGGVSRGVNDILQNDPKSLTQKEFPPSDLDAIAAEGKYNPRVVAEIAGVDPDGLEKFQGNKIDFSDFVLGRDTTQNQVYLDSEGLHYSNEARDAAKSGKIKIVGGYKPNKAIYGIDLVVTDGITLCKPRGLMRLVKPVAEGKALEFDYLPLNSIMDFGIYSLFLARKWSKRDDFGALLQNMFYLESQMGQVRYGETNVMRYLRGIHNRNPYYDMKKNVMNMHDLALYKSTKLIKQIDREFGWANQIPSGLVVERHSHDTLPKRISLDGFSPTNRQSDQIIKWWPCFLKECEKRTQIFNEKSIDPVNKYFLKQDMEDAEIDRDFI